MWYEPPEDEPDEPFPVRQMLEVTVGFSVVVMLLGGMCPVDESLRLPLAALTGLVCLVLLWPKDSGPPEVIDLDE
jgi:hypothetical protein